MSRTRWSRCVKAFESTFKHSISCIFRSVFVVNSLIYFYSFHRIYWKRAVFYTYMCVWVTCSIYRSHNSSYINIENSRTFIHFCICIPDSSGKNAQCIAAGMNSSNTQKDVCCWRFVIARTKIALNAVAVQCIRLLLLFDLPINHPWHIACTQTKPLKQTK